MVADWLNQMFSHGKPFLKFSRLHLVLRILQMCYDIGNGSYSCFCAANLITSLHALTTFHCVDNRAYGDKCAERDFSDGEKKIFYLSGCPLSEGSELLFFHHHRENKKITHPFDNWAECHSKNGAECLSKEEAKCLLNVGAECFWKEGAKCLSKNWAECLSKKTAPSVFQKTGFISFL